MVLLGSPRASYTGDLTPMLARIHVLAIKLIGALEWTFPLWDRPRAASSRQGLSPEATRDAVRAEGADRARHTIAGNYRQILQWILAGRLVVDPLRTHLLPPDRCQEAYFGLTHHKDQYLGVVFDWTEEQVG